MTPSEDNTIETSLRELFPEDYLREQAEKTHVIQRKRKVDIIALFWTLVLGFGIGKDRKIADLRRGYITATGLPAARCAAQAGQWICRPVCVRETARRQAGFGPFPS